MMTRKVVMIGFADFQLLDVTGPLEVFSCASRLLAQENPAGPTPYAVSFVAESAGPVASSSGLALVAERSWRDLGTLDTLLVSGGVGIDQALRSAELVDWLRANATRARRYGSVCTGAMLLARAGLLEGRRVTTHWASTKRLAEMAPTAHVQPDAVFTRDGHLWTSAGVTAGMDMALAMVEADWGRKLALEVARQLVMYIKRTGGASQLSAALDAQSRALQGRFRDLAAWVLAHPEADMSIATLAQESGMSTRHFARCFRAEMGMTPAKFVEGVRFEAACQALGEGRESVDSISARCGFGSAETLRRVFIRRTGLSPAAYRRRLQRGSARGL
jgi:transcriptional regulator GlxA family with amidase domain